MKENGEAVASPLGLLQLRGRILATDEVALELPLPVPLPPALRGLKGFDTVRFTIRRARLWWMTAEMELGSRRDADVPLAHAVVYV